MRSSIVAVVQDEVAPDLAAGLRRTAELTAQAAARVPGSSCFRRRGFPAIRCGSTSVATSRSGITRR